MLEILDHVGCKPPYMIKCVILYQPKKLTLSGLGHSQKSKNKNNDLEYLKYQKYQNTLIGKKETRNYKFHLDKAVSWQLTHQEMYSSINKLISISPDEWAITKKACQDERVVSYFFSANYFIYALLSRIEHYLLKPKHWL